MKIIGAQQAGSILILPLDDVRPMQGIIPQQIIDVLAPKYKFANRPRPGPGRSLLGTGFSAPGNPVQFVIPAPLTLQNGVAAIDDKNIAISRLDVMPDVSRIVVQTVTTEEGDLILDDVSSVLEGACGFRNAKTLATRQHISTVVVQFEKNLEDQIGVLREIQKIISPAMQSENGVNREAEFERIAFAFDPTQLPASQVGQVNGFVLERRAEHPFSENRYFSAAPLRTGDHIKVLEQIGALLEGKN